MYSFGIVMNKNKIIPPVYFFAAILLMFVLHFLAPLAKILAFPWTLLGILLLMLGIVFNLMTVNIFKRNDTTIKPFLESKHLVTTGIFKISRNPIYLGFLFFLVGIAVLMGTLSPFLPIILFFYLINIIFVRYEENKLENSFGDAWFEYKNSVRRWL